LKGRRASVAFFAWRSTRRDDCAQVASMICLRQGRRRMVETRNYADKNEGAAEAARVGAQAIRDAIRARGAARIVVATGASQFELLKHLVAAPGIDWSKVTAFHLDEYIGLPVAHPASFRRYLRERFLAPLPEAPVFHEVNGEAADPAAECARLGALLREGPIDVCFAGIGENGHLAFNDPPADFDTRDAYLVVDLDDACRNQQFGEGWFPSFDAVPRRAISMSVPQMMQSALLLLVAPDARKAKAVAAALEGPLTPLVPASMIQRHPDCRLYLDDASAALLKTRPR
jgi:glucosamine-6-phosphate deaminase